jgi:hypothetical protein
MVGTQRERKIRPRSAGDSAASLTWPPSRKHANQMSESNDLRPMFTLCS